MRIPLLIPIILAASSGIVNAQETTPTTIRFGIIGTDTSHAVQFTRILNKTDDKEHIPGGRVTHAFKGGSPDVEMSSTRVDKFAAELKDEYGVEFVDSIPDLCAKVDAILLESVDGRPHLEQAKPAFAAKKPIFIDKPLAASLADAQEIARLAKESGTPCFSASSLRFWPGVANLKDNDKIGEITGVDAYSPCMYEEHHPDLVWYGIHGVETLFTLMGPGCESVTRTHTDDYDVVVGTWKDGRIGTFRGVRAGNKGYGALVFGEKSIEHTPPVSSLYSPLVHEIINFVRTGKPPVTLDETIRMFAFMEAADESKRQGGKTVRLDDVLKKAK